MVDIGCGAYHSLIVVEEESENGPTEVVFTFGSNIYGQLGNGTFLHSHEMQKIFVPPQYDFTFDQKKSSSFSFR